MATSKPLLLLVASDEMLAEITGFRLELIGYQVHHAPSGEEAMKRAQEHLPDLFLIQLDLPGISGLALIEQLATETETARVPVLALSTDADLETVQRAVATGASDYLVVPFDPLVLDAKVAQMLQDRDKAAKSEKLVPAKV